ncbi:hypothetical protein [Candidatus Nitrospira salsa]
MASTPAEQALSRVCDYLLASGVELNHEMNRQALQLVEAAFNSGEKDLLAFVMTRMPEHFMLKTRELPPPAPKIVRGSIEYGG